jgi:hypothetical protein
MVSEIKDLFLTVQDKGLCHENLDFYTLKFSKIALIHDKGIQFFCF